jgi:hypothetical protein
MANGPVTEPIEERRASANPSIKTLTLKMAGAMSAETSEPLEHSVHFNPESRSHKFSSHGENLRKNHCLILLSGVNTKVLTLHSDRDLLITLITVTLSGSKQHCPTATSRTSEPPVVLSASSAPQPHCSWLRVHSLTTAAERETWHQCYVPRFEPWIVILHAAGARDH